MQTGGRAPLPQAERERRCEDKAKDEKSFQHDPVVFQSGQLPESYLVKISFAGPGPARYEDRCQIYALSKRGASQESIASVLGVSQSAVSREMRRNRGQRGYRFKQAEAKACTAARF